MRWNRMKNSLKDSRAHTHTHTYHLHIATSIHLNHRQRRKEVDYNQPTEETSCQGEKESISTTYAHVNALPRFCSNEKNVFTYMPLLHRKGLK